MVRRPGRFTLEVPTMLVTLMAQKAGSVMAGYVLPEIGALIGIALAPLALDFHELDLGNLTDESWT
jgi:hypothetical protein